MSNTVAIGMFVIAILALLLATFLTGYMFRNISDLRKQVKYFINELDDDGSAIVETTPQLIREKERTNKIDTEDSQVVVIKSPRQVAADRERKLSEELDKLGR